MADSKITDLNSMTAGVLARTIDVVPIVDVSAVEDKKVTIQQLMDDAPANGTNAGSMSAADKTKLDGIATGATANSSDAFLLNRANHTGTQTASTISDFNETAQDAVGTILTDSSTIDFTYNDAGNTITAAVVANSIGNTQLRTGAATSVVGRSANSVGALADIAATADGQYLTRSSGALTFATIPNFTSSTAGLAPASGGGTTNFLRADGTWAAPPGGGGGGGFSVLSTNYSTVTVSNSTTETTVFSYSLTGGTLGANGGLKLYIGFRFQNASGTGVTFRYRLKLGGTIIHNSVTHAITSATGQRPCWLEVNIRNNASESSQIYFGNISIGGLGGALTTGVYGGAGGTGFSGGGFGGTSAINTASTQILAVSFQLGTANANARFDKYYAILEQH